MRKIVVTTFMSLDGVMEDPQWTGAYWNDEIAKYKYEELFASDAMLLGRVTYEGFAASWPGQTDEQGFGDRMNNMPKYVASNTLDKAEWTNSHIIKGDLAEEVMKLKQQPGEDIIVHGSATLTQWLLEAGLVDVIKLLTYPVVVGKGKRLFKDGSAIKMNLLETKTLGSGVVALIYQPVPVEEKK
jgi:dihydrofolate reductase